MQAIPSQALAFLENAQGLVDAELERLLTSTSAATEQLQDAICYSLLGGGKRIRPALCLAAAEAVGQPPEKALVPACALEAIHAYSLVHDDLPAMDDDDLRRGRPTVHIAFNEATAILAGDALQASAFGWLTHAPALSDTTRLTMVSELARASGQAGMVGGQAIDLESVGKTLTVEALETMHRHKTGALIEASVRLGAMTADPVPADSLARLTDYASALGLAFQVQDDLLDIEGDTAVIGKPQGSDAARDKPTYPALLGIPGAKAHLQELLDRALERLDTFGPEADPLRAIANYIVVRSH